MCVLYSPINAMIHSSPMFEKEIFCVHYIETKATICYAYFFFKHVGSCMSFHLNLEEQQSTTPIHLANIPSVHLLQQW
jgi:hypothetical protein